MYVFEKSVTEARKLRSSKLLEGVLESGDLVLIYAGESIQKPGGLDQTYHFLCHPDYYWLSALQRPSGLMAYSKDEGWIHFVKASTKEELVWDGLAFYYEARDVSEIPAYLQKKNAKRVTVLGQPTREQASQDNSDTGFHDQVQEAINRARRVKDTAEIALIQKTFHAAHAGFKHLKKIIRPGLSEKHLQLEYEHIARSEGAERFPYETLIGSGTQSAILHAIPSTKILKEGELVVVDAGADISDYCVDITRAFAVNGSFNERQKAIYDLVLKSQLAAIEMCRPHVEWSAVHIATARVLSEGLKDLGIFKSSVDSILESGAISVFFPHGVGHMVGLRVRDVGGRPNITPKQYCGVRIRVDLPLEENFLMTVEPGLYFIAGLMNDSELRAKYSDHVNWVEADKWKDFGGIRIEDNILITAKGPQNLTSALEK